MSQLREETPPPRRRIHAEPEVQQVWSAQPGANDWTESPLTAPREQVAQANIKRDCLVPLKVNEDLCFSSPKPARGNNDLGIDGLTPGVETGLFMSPSPVSSGSKENRLPVAQGMRPVTAPVQLTGPRTPLKTPSRLPTVQEHDGQAVMPPLDELPEAACRETMPAWVVRSPEPAQYEDMHCSLPKPTIKGTFIQFVSPLKTFSVMSPPKTEPVNFAPSASTASVLFADRGHLSAMSDSPSPWYTHEEIPFFPAPSVAHVGHVEPTPMTPIDSDLAATPGAEPKQKGPVVRLADALGLADLLAEPPAGAPPCQSVLDPELILSQSSEAYCFNPIGTPMPSMMPTNEAGSGFNFDGMTSTGYENMDAQQQWPQMLQMQQQCPPPQMQGNEQMQHSQAQPQPPVDQAMMQQMQMQMQQMQMQQMQMQQMQVPQMQPPLMAAPQMQPPQMQPPQMQAPQMPQMPAMQMPQMPAQGGDQNLFLQQLMGMQMPPSWPPSWPPMQPPSSMACEQGPPPPPQAAMEATAPSVLCPSACHQAQVCRCGEAKLGDAAQSADQARWADVTDEQQLAAHGAAPSRFVLSAAMFPEMGQ